MLTARDAESDILVGLGVGADDYMTKPFSPGSWWPGSGPCCGGSERSPAPPGAAIAVGDLEIDPEARRVRRGEEEVHLTPTEFDLLSALAARPGVVLTREPAAGRRVGVPGRARRPDR